MSDVYSDHYWRDEFAVTEADIKRLKDYITSTKQAYDLTALANRVVRGRLKYGAEVSPAASGVKGAYADHSVRLWNPADKWQVGDHTIVVRPIRGGDYGAFVGEVTAIQADHVEIHLDGFRNPVKYLQATPGSDDALRWRNKVQEVVEKQRKSIETQKKSQPHIKHKKRHLETILIEHGNRIAGQLLDALRADKRFTRLAGRWFLRNLAVLPSKAQLSALAWAMLDLETPQPTDALLAYLPPPLAKGDAGLFGLYLAMRDQPALFANANPGQRPHWKLTGPPPGPTTARYPAYDPDTYRLLCREGDMVEDKTAIRLWELDLFRVVCARNRLILDKDRI